MNDKNYAESPSKQSFIYKNTAKFHSFYQLVKTKIAPPPLGPGRKEAWF